MWWHEERGFFNQLHVPQIQGTPYNVFQNRDSTILLLFLESLFKVRLKMFRVCWLMTGMPDNDCVKCYYSLHDGTPYNVLGVTSSQLRWVKQGLHTLHWRCFLVVTLGVTGISGGCCCIWSGGGWGTNTGFSSNWIINNRGGTCCTSCRSETILPDVLVALSASCLRLGMIWWVIWSSMAVPVVPVAGSETILPDALVALSASCLRLGMIWWVIWSSMTVRLVGGGWW